MSDIIKILADKRNIPYEQAHYIVMNFWENLRKEIASNKGKEIMIHNFGRFIVDDRNLDYKIETLQKTLEKHEAYFTSNRDIMDYNTWIQYIKKNIILNKELKKCFKIKATIDKRNNRLKGERGL